MCFNLCKVNKTDLYYEDIILKYEKKKEKEKNKISTDIIEESSINENESSKNMEEISKIINYQSETIPKSLKKNKNNKNSPGNTRHRRSTILERIEVNNSAEKKSQKNLNEKNLKGGENNSFPTVTMPLLFGKEKLEKNYWNNNLTRKRSGKKQKTVKLSGMKFIDNKLNIIVNYAYSINDFFSNGNFNMDRLKPLNFDDLKRNLKDSNVVYKQLSESEKRNIY